MTALESTDGPAAPADADLLPRLHDGAQAAMGTLLKRYSGLVYGTAHRVLRRSDLSADVTQEVFLRLLREADNIHPRSLAAWLHRAAHHSALNLLRAENRRRRRELIMSENLNSPDYPEHPALGHLDAALERLSGTERESVIARFHGEAGFDTIARHHGKSADAARMTVNRALEKMRLFLQTRGVALSVTALATLMSAELTRAMPAGAGAVTASTLLTAAKTAPAAGLSFKGFTTLTALIMTKPAPLAIAALVIFCVTWGGGYLANRPAPPSPAAVDTAAEAPPGDRTSVAALKKQPASSAQAPSRAELAVERFVAMAKEIAALAEEIRSRPGPDDSRRLEKLLTLRRRAASLFHPLTAEETAECVDLLKKQSPRFEFAGVELLFERMLQLDPKQARELFDSVGMPGSGTGSLLGRAYGLHDPRAALLALDGWYAQDAAQRSSFLRGVWNGWIERDAAASVAALEEIPVDDQRKLVDEYAGFDLLSTLRADAAAALSALTDDTLRASVVASMTKRWAGTDPRAAATWFDLIQWRDAEAGFEPAMRLSADWMKLGEKDPAQLEAALLWLAPKVPEALRESVYDETNRKFGEQFPAAAAAFRPTASGAN